MFHRLIALQRLLVEAARAVGDADEQLLAGRGADIQRLRQFFQFKMPLQRTEPVGAIDEQVQGVHGPSVRTQDHVREHGIDDHYGRLRIFLRCFLDGLPLTGTQQSRQRE